MKKAIHTIFIVSGILPATILLFVSIFSIFHLCTGTNITNYELLIIGMNVLGILGYFGLILRLIVHRFKKWTHILFLLCGVISFVLFNSTGPPNAWNWVFTMQEPGEWFILVWPTIVSLCEIFYLAFKKEELTASST